MNINLTQLGDRLSVALYILGILFGGLVANSVAKRTAHHITRSTIIGTLLSLIPPLNLIHLLFLLRDKKDETIESNANT